jgi:Ca2+-binding EF-hand superfamily protein
MDETNKTNQTPKSGFREEPNLDIEEENKAADKLLYTVNSPGKNNLESDLHEAFNEFDEDHSGAISREELGNFMHKLGYFPTAVELQEMIDEVDKDRIGQIGFHEFKTILNKTIKDEFTLNSSIDAFAVFDKTKSGTINKETLMSILMTKDDQNLSQEEIQELLDNIEYDENGEINYKDLVINAFSLSK